MNQSILNMKKGSILLLWVLASVAAFAQSENGKEFQPSGKVLLNVFSNFNTSFSNGTNASAFALDRVYFGYQYHFSENLTGKLNLDIGNPESGKLEMVAYIKNAYVEYSNQRLSAFFGLISTTQFKVQEGFWGYRYIEKSFQDAYKLGSSADLGLSIAYEFTDWLSADGIIVNGEGYKKVQADNDFRAGAGVTLTPIKGLILRGYFDAMSSVNAQTTLATFAGYKNKVFSLGAEYNQQQNVGKVGGRTLSGVSAYATVKPVKNIQVFARFDQLGSNPMEGASENWNISNDGSLIMAGIEYQPVKGVKLAPNYRLWSSADGQTPARHQIFLNLELKL